MRKDRVSYLKTVISERLPSQELPRNDGVNPPFPVICGSRCEVAHSEGASDYAETNHTTGRVPSASPYSISGASGGADSSII
ncbi:hypothetical protein ACN42_g5311 [Penicillium freii]|uniref:Uncharacterized protein n=1 Tax=Penicillium freii TaxID=48697 RepID=A0A101MJL7_PENFR|nr:hypothetical protein ACN42_g5311 [Penicillium freii]